MKVLAIIIFCSCLIVGAGVWVFYPTSVQSEMKTFRILSQSEFSSLRKDALEFAHQFEVKGLKLTRGILIHLLSKFIARVCRCCL